MKHSGADLTNGPVGPHLVRLTIPMFLGISSMIMAAMIDTVYVGWIGTLELAAVSFTFPLVMALTTLPMGIGVGAASIIARVVGEGDRLRVRRLSTNALLLVAVLVATLTGITMWAIEPLFVLLGAEDDILPIAVMYMKVWLFGLPVFAIPMVATTLMRAVGNARLPGVLMTVGAGMQVVLAPVLIFGIPDLWPGLGLVGAAWGFVLSRILVFLAAVFFLRRMDLLNFESRSIAERIDSWREVLRIGVPSVATNLIGPVSMAVIVAMLAEFGHEVVAGFGVASRIESLATMVLMALSASTGPFIGQNWGRGLVDRIESAQRLAYRFSFAWGMFAFLVLAASGRVLVGAINEDPGVIEATYLYLLLVPVTYGFLGSSMVAGSTFIALGKPLPPLVLSVARMAVFYVPLALLLQQWFGYGGIFAAAGICNLLLGVLSVVWVRRFLNTRAAQRLNPG
ncbi:MAG: MATE family efflux transporter [Pseudomonadales bacterium]